MRIPPAQSRAYTYTITNDSGVLPVLLATFKEHINVTNVLQDNILTLYLTAAAQFAEFYTNRVLITKTFQTFRDFFPNASQNEGYYPFGQIPGGSSTLFPSTKGNVGFEIRRSPLVTINSIQYTDENNVLQTVDNTTYYFDNEKDYSEVLLVTDGTWPSDSNNRLQNIVIDFDAGMGTADTDIDACWQLAIMNHATAMWANRGDCSAGKCSDALPSQSKLFYDTKRLHNL